MKIQLANVVAGLAQELMSCLFLRLRFSIKNEAEVFIWH